MSEVPDEGGGWGVRKKKKKKENLFFFYVSVFPSAALSGCSYDALYRSAGMFFACAGTVSGGVGKIKWGETDGRTSDRPARF